MFRQIAELINRMLIFVAIFILILGGINAIFDTNLGIKIGAERIALPEDFIGVVFGSVALLILSALLSLGLNFKKIVGRIKAEPLKVGGATFAGLIAAGIVGYLGVLQLSGGRLPLAVGRGDFDAVQSILAENEFDQTTLDDSLYQAVANGDYDIAEALIEHGADVDHTFGEFDSPLLHAAVLWYEVGATEFLLQQGADPNKVDSLGRSPMVEAVLYRAQSHSEASQNEATDIVIALLAAGADPNLAADNGDTPVEIAERYGYANIIAKLDS